MEPIAALRAEAIARAHHAHPPHADRIRGPRLPKPRNPFKDRLLALLRVKKIAPAAKGKTHAGGKGACC